MFKIIGNPDHIFKLFGIIFIPITKTENPGGPEGYVWENPARIQEPGGGGELGQVLGAVSPTAQGATGCQLRRVVARNILKDENGSREIFENQPVAGCSRCFTAGGAVWWFLVRFSPT